MLNIQVSELQGKPRQRPLGTYYTQRAARVLGTGTDQQALA